MRAKVLLVGLIPLAMATAACGGVTGELVDTICICEHCDDWKEAELKAALDASSDVADAYACDLEYESYILCQVDQGECDEEAASWTVTEPGSCDGTTDTMVPCTTTADCAALGGTCGGTGTCTTKSCSGSGAPCSSDSDCSGGSSKCDDEIKDLSDCIDDGSEHRGPSVDFD